MITSRRIVETPVCRYVCVIYGVIYLLRALSFPLGTVKDQRDQKHGHPSIWYIKIHTSTHLRTHTRWMGFNIHVADEQRL